MSTFKYTNKKQPVLQALPSQFRLNITKQSQQSDICDFSLNSKNNLRSQQCRQNFTNQNQKTQKQSQSSLLYELTEKERQMIADLSKIFIAQNPNRKKISIKINEIKRCHDKNEECKGCFNCRIDRIQITRLPESEKIQIPEIIHQYKHTAQISEVLFGINKSSQTKMQASKNGAIQSNKRMLGKPKNKNLQIVRTIAITYRPQQYSECNYSRIRSFNQAPFTKFRKGSGCESPKSNVSINQEMLFDEEFSQSNTQENDLAFIKLLDLNSFVRRKHVERQMLGISNAANQKIQRQYNKLKEKLKAQRREFSNKLQELANQNQKLNAQLSIERVQKNKLYDQIQNLKKSLKQVREIKQIFLRQNNNLKEKMKQNDKIIQEMRRELNKIYQGEHINLNKINSYKNIGDQSKKFPTQDKNYLTQMEISNNFNIRPKYSSKIDNLNSNHNITRRVQSKRDNKEQTSNQGSVKSQRTIGIRKNSPSGNINSLQQKKQVKIASNYDTDHANNNQIYVYKDQKEIKSIKSVSYYSQISSSLSQRVGYIKKPTKEAHRGILVDYMLDDPDEKNDDLAKQIDRKNSQFCQQKNRGTGSPRERFQYKSIK